MIGELILIGGTTQSKNNQIERIDTIYICIILIWNNSEITVK